MSGCELGRTLCFTVANYVHSHLQLLQYTVIYCRFDSYCCSNTFCLLLCGDFAVPLLWLNVQRNDISDHFLWFMVSLWDRNWRHQHQDTFGRCHPAFSVSAVEITGRVREAAGIELPALHTLLSGLSTCRCCWSGILMPLATCCLSRTGPESHTHSVCFRSFLYGFFGSSKVEPQLVDVTVFAARSPWELI